MLVEAINEGVHAVVPELDHAAVQTRQDPWPLAVETQALHSIALRLKLGQHFLRLFFPAVSTQTCKEIKSSSKNWIRNVKPIIKIGDVNPQL